MSSGHGMRRFRAVWWVRPRHVLGRRPTYRDDRAPPSSCPWGDVCCDGRTRHGRHVRRGVCPTVCPGRIDVCFAAVCRRRPPPNVYIVPGRRHGGGRSPQCDVPQCHRVPRLGWDGRRHVCVCRYLVDGGSVYVSHGRRASRPVCECVCGAVPVDVCRTRNVLSSWASRFGARYRDARVYDARRRMRVCRRVDGVGVYVSRGRSRARCVAVQCRTRVRPGPSRHWGVCGGEGAHACDGTAQPNHRLHVLARMDPTLGRVGTVALRDRVWVHGLYVRTQLEWPRVQYPGVGVGPRKGRRQHQHHRRDPLDAGTMRGDEQARNRQPRRRDVYVCRLGRRRHGHGGQRSCTAPVCGRGVSVRYSRRGWDTPDVCGPWDVRGTVPAMGVLRRGPRQSSVWCVSHGHGRLAIGPFHGRRRRTGNRRRFGRLYSSRPTTVVGYVVPEHAPHVS